MRHSLLAAIALFLVSPVCARQPGAEPPPLKKSLTQLSKALDTSMSSLVALDSALDRKAAALAPLITRLQKIQGDLKSASAGVLETAADCKGTLDGLKRQEKARATLLGVLERIVKWSGDLRSSGIRDAFQIVSGYEVILMNAAVHNSIQAQSKTREPRASLASLESLCRDLGQAQKVVAKAQKASVSPINRIAPPEPVAKAKVEPVAKAKVEQIAKHKAEMAGRSVGKAKAEPVAKAKAELVGKAKAEQEIAPTIIEGESAPGKDNCAELFPEGGYVNSPSGGCVKSVELGK